MSINSVSLLFVCWFLVGCESKPSKEELKLSAESGDIIAQAELGRMIKEGRASGSYDEAYSWLSKAANSGNNMAQYDIAFMYERGLLGKTNYQEALIWYMKSAEQGRAEAQRRLGDLYQEGEIVGKNISLALDWYRKAANQMDANAQRKLGMMYYSGEGIATDMPTAYMWLLLSESAGDSMAGVLVELVEKEMSAQECARGRTLAENWKPR